MALIAVVCCAFGTAIGARMQSMQAFPLIMNFVMMPLFFLSGALYPLQGLPKALQVVTAVNPLSYGVDGLRGALIGQSHFGILVGHRACSRCGGGAVARVRCRGRSPR